MDLEKVLAEIEEAQDRMALTNRLASAPGSTRVAHENARCARVALMNVLLVHAPLLLAALKVAIARNNERGVMVWHSGMGDATEQAEAAFKALAEGE